MKINVQLYEQSINFINTMVIKRLSELTNKKEKEDLLFDIVGRFNKTEASALKDYYNGNIPSSRNSIYGIEAEENVKAVLLELEK